MQLGTRNDGVFRRARRLGTTPRGFQSRGLPMTERRSWACLNAQCSASAKACSSTERIKTRTKPRVHRANWQALETMVTCGRRKLAVQKRDSRPRGAREASRTQALVQVFGAPWDKVALSGKQSLSVLCLCEMSSRAVPTSAYLP